MESAAVPTRRSTEPKPPAEVGDKGLKKNAIGELGEGIMGRARAQAGRDARMIVVGSFAEAPLKGIILGSTANKLLHLAERPVLVVPAKED